MDLWLGGDLLQGRREEGACSVRWRWPRAHRHLCKRRARWCHTHVQKGAKYPLESSCYVCNTVCSYMRWKGISFNFSEALVERIFNTWTKGFGNGMFWGHKISLFKQIVKRTSIVSRLLFVRDINKLIIALKVSVFYRVLRVATQ